MDGRLVYARSSWLDSWGMAWSVLADFVCVLSTDFGPSLDLCDV